MWLQQNGQIRLKLTNLCFPWALKRSMGFQLTQTWGSSWVLPFTSRRRKASFSPFKKSAESWRTEWTDAPPPRRPRREGVEQTYASCLVVLKLGCSLEPPGDFQNILIQVTSQISSILGVNVRHQRSLSAARVIPRGCRA